MIGGDGVDIARLKARAASGEMVRLARLKAEHALYPADEVVGVAAGSALDRMGKLPRQLLSPGIGIERSELAYSSA